MPRVEKEEGYNEPQQVGRCQGNNQGVEDLVFDDVGERELIRINLSLDTSYSYEDRCEHEVSEALLATDPGYERKCHWHTP